MTINTDLLIAAPMLQDYLVDKDSGLPLTAGIITLWQDDQRYVNYKNWYYQTGIPGNYTWTPLDNPLTLSNAGTIQDPNGNDVIPFYYPYDEDDQTIAQPYFITVYNSAGTLQFTRENFPFLPSNNSPTIQKPTFRNYILNNVYWRNIGSLDVSEEKDVIIAPSQHDGFTNGDIRFLKDVTGADDSLTFSPMVTTLNDDITPEYFLNFQCGSVQVGETVKCIQYPISLHVRTLQNVPATLVFQAQNVSGNPNNYVDLYVYQYLGTGAISQPAPILIKRVVLSNAFEKYVIPFIFPNYNNPSTGLAVGPGGDDALFLRVQYPLSAICEINHTKPQLYLSQDVPDNDFDTYDQIEPIINSPRTGDVRISLNSFQPGWVIANDGVISNSGTFTLPTNVPSARANIDTWPLYNFIWNNTKPEIAPIYTNVGILTTRGANAITDWSANKQLQLTLTLGRAFVGLPPAVNVTYDRTVTPTWGSVAGTFTVSAGSTSLFYVGAPIYLTGTMPTSGNFVAGTIYYCIPSIDGSSTTQFQLASSYANAIAGTAIAAGAASDNGSNIVVNFALGGSLGQSRHVQLRDEIGAHSHPGSNQNRETGTLGAANSINSNSSLNVSTTIGNINVASDGSSHPFNIIPPEIYGNIYFKL